MSQITLLHTVFARFVAAMILVAGVAFGGQAAAQCAFGFVDPGDPSGPCDGCFPGFAGAYCDQCAPNYYSYSTCRYCVASTTCGGIGTCTSVGTCACPSNYAGTTCAQCAPNHYNFPSCTYCDSATTCSGNGTCDGAGACVCEVGFIGSNCNQCAPGRFGPDCTECPGGQATPCGGHGTCDDGVAGSGTCACDAGYDGVDCLDPVITSILPASNVRPGDLVTITGRLFGAAGDVWVGGQGATIVAYTDSQIAFVMPQGVGVVLVNVERDSDLRASNSVYLSYAPPAITSVSPISIAIFTTPTLTIQGTGFGSSADAGSVTFGGSYCEPLSWSNTQITCVPDPQMAAGLASLSVRAGSLSSATVSVTVTGCAAGTRPDLGVLACVDCPDGQTGDGTSCDECAIDHYDYPSCTFCDAATTCGGNGTCTSTGSCACDGDNTGPDCLDPRASTASPQSGVSTGTIVTITGANFGLNGSVLVDGTNVPPLLFTNSLVSFAMPVGSGTVDVVVARADGRQTDPLAITYAPPSIASFSPSSAQVYGAPFTLTINGSNFGPPGGGTVTIGSFVCAPTSWSGTRIECTAPSLSPVGNLQLSVTAAGQQSPTSPFVVRACAAGSFVDVANRACSLCPAGTASDDGLDCVDCLAGSFAAEAGATACEPCPAGSSQPATGQRFCFECGDGECNGSETNASCTEDCPSVCGNNTREIGEVCDRDAVDGLSCTLLGYDGGEIGCLEDCSDLVLGGCFVCGDGVVGGDEVCDRDEVLGATCEDEGYDSGWVGCNDDCSALDYATCGLCGDGVLDDEEACDDGDDNSDTAPNACRTDCLLPFCGDGVVDDGEGCDQGDALSALCRPDCSLPTCGDGIVDDGEDCDDGDDNSDARADACRTTCTVSRCGDGVIDSSEDCDQGDANSDTTPDACRTDCEPPRCGDNIVDSFEECDLGASNGGELCDDNCLEVDVPDDLGGDDTGAIDAGPTDAGDDTGESDAGDDTVEADAGDDDTADTSAPDVDDDTALSDVADDVVAADTAAVDDTTTDTQADATEPETGSDPDGAGPAGGGCAATSRVPSGVGGALWLLVMLSWRRRPVGAVRAV